MRRINKQQGVEPQELTNWKRANPHGIYADLTEVERQAIRHQCTTEQFYLCAYCGKSISGTNANVFECQPKTECLNALPMRESRDIRPVPSSNVGSLKISN